MKTDSKKFKKRAATCVVTLTAAGLSFGVVACGGSDNEAAASGTGSAVGDQTTMPAGAPGAGGPMAGLTEEQTACLEEEGVTLPEAPGSGGTPPGAATGGDATDGEAGAAPDIEAMQAAAATCGIEMPEPPDGEAPQGTPPSAATGATSS